jgi:hypothetical protein
MNSLMPPSRNVLDLRAYSPKPNPRGGYNRLYDANKGSYVEPWLDAVLARIRAGMQAERSKKYDNATFDEWLNSLSPEDQKRMEEAERVFTAPYLGGK